MANINQTTTTTLIVNGRAAQQELDRIKRTLADIQSAKNRIKAQPLINPNDKRELKNLTLQERELRREMKHIESATKDVHRVMANLNKAKPAELQAAIKALNKELKNTERGSAAWNKHTQQIRLLQTELKKVNAELKANTSLWERFTTTANRVASAVGAITAATAAMVMAGRSAVQAYADMDEQMTNTQKYTGLAREGVEELNEAFKNMNTRTGRDKLNELAQEAGRLGFNTQETVKQYVEAADIINVALVDLGEGATQTIAKLTNIFGVQETLGVRDSMLSVGSAVNVLSQNCTASKPYLVEFAQRMAGIGAQAGMTIPQILAFGATLDANGQKVEMSASALGRLTMLLFQKTGEIAKTVGLDVAQFTDTLKNSTYEGIMMFLDALNKMGEGEGLAALAPLFKDLGMDGVRMSQVLSSLAKHLDMVKWETKEANKAFREATSATREYNLFNNTTQAGIDKAKKRFKELAIELGEKLAPVYRHVITSGSAMMRLLKLIVDFVIKHKEAVLISVGALVAYKTAIIATTVATKAWGLATKAFNGVLLLVEASMTRVKTATGTVNGAMRLLNETIKKNPFGFFVTVIMSVITVIETLISIFKKEEVATENATIALIKHRKELRDIGEEAGRAAAKETAALTSLWDAVNSETLAREKRLEALKKLQELYPDYFSNISLEIVGTEKATLAYNALCVQILNVAKAKAAAAKIEENEGKLLDLQMQNDRLRSERTPYLSTRNESLEGFKRSIESLKTAKGYSNNPNYASTEQREARSTRDYHRLRFGIATFHLARIDARLKSNEQEIKELMEANQWLTKEYEVTVDLFKDAVTGDFGGGGFSPKGIDKKVGKTGSGHGGDGSNKFHAEDQWKAEALNANSEAWMKGQKSYKDFVDRIYDIDIEYLQKKMQNNKATEKEIDSFAKQLAEARVKKLKHEQAELEAEMKMRQKEHDTAVKLERANLELQQKEELSSLTTRYMYGMVTQKEYNAKKLQIELQCLEKIKNLYEKNTKERADIEKKQLEMLTAYKLEQAKEAAKKSNEYFEKYFGNMPLDDKQRKEQYDAASNALFLALDRALAGAGGDEAKIAEIRKRYDKARKDLEDSFNKKNDKDDKEKSPLRRWLNKWIESLGLSDTESKAIVDTINNMANSLGTIWSSITAMQEAEMEMQINNLTKRYDAEISMAEGNAYRVKEIEKKKQQEIKKLKDQALKRQMAIQIVQAVATTAEGAINAYTSALKMPYPANMILAPIAAAIATAAGMLQVATIKKQAAATASGYAEGGFTKPGGKYDPAGIVHAGEWVASQELVKSPVTRPIIEALDYAQRHNTIGSLSSADASNVVSRSAVTMASGQAVTSVIAELAVQMQQQKAVIAALRDRLNEPFVTVNTVTGDKGIKNAQDEYTRMMNNATRKSNRTAL